MPITRRSDGGGSRYSLSLQRSPDDASRADGRRALRTAFRNRQPIFGIIVLGGAVNGAVSKARGESSSTRASK